MIISSTRIISRTTCLRTLATAAGSSTSNKNFSKLLGSGPTLDEFVAGDIIEPSSRVVLGNTKTYEFILNKSEIFLKTPFLPDHGYHPTSKPQYRLERRLAKSRRIYEGWDYTPSAKRLDVQILVIAGAEVPRRVQVRQRARGVQQLQSWYVSSISPIQIM
jgi:hypothetical protein